MSEATLAAMVIEYLAEARLPSAGHAAQCRGRALREPEPQQPYGRRPLRPGERAAARLDGRRAERSGDTGEVQQVIGAEDVRVSMPLFQSGRGGSSPTSALQLTVRKCGIYWARELNAAWHSLLPVTDHGNLVRFPKSVAYWADYNDVAYAVAIWSSPIAANRLTDGWAALELRRFAIAPDAPPNSASRMLAVMRRLIQKEWPEINKLISYQATEHHKGTPDGKLHQKVISPSGILANQQAKFKLFHKKCDGKWRYRRGHEHEQPNRQGRRCR